MTVEQQKQRERSRYGDARNMPGDPDIPCEGEHHTHIDRNGLLVDCYHSTKNMLLSGSFWFGVTFSFPLEHYIWEKVWPFTLITQFLGL